jgi:putative transposase
VLAWRLSNTLDAEFCVEALEDALSLHGRPEIFNTDQGSQGGFKRLSQHHDEGGCDDHSKAAIGSIWEGAIAVPRSTASGRTR